MIKLIVLLRGINVGGHRKILMADLKTMCLNIGFKNPITYIQSGNLIVESDVEDLEKVKLLLTESILNTFGHQVPVLVKTVSEYEEILRNNPFYSDTIDPKQLHITFLSHPPDSEDVSKIEPTDFGIDKFKIVGDVVYLYIQTPYHKTKLSNVFFEKKLGVSTTTRNWKTSNKLLSLLNK